MKRSANVADHYNAISDWGKKGRMTSGILHLRQYNNWIKSVLINNTAKKVPGRLRVLDLCCGKGGDLLKWKTLDRVDYYHGLDIAEESITDAWNRYHEHRDIFTAQFEPFDCFHEPLKVDRARFDLVSCMFALHYAFESAETSRMAFRNIFHALRPGGYFIATLPFEIFLNRPFESFGNSIFNVKFKDQNSADTSSLADAKQTASDRIEGSCPSSHASGDPADRVTQLFKRVRSYDFYLAESVYDCEEFTVPIPLIKALCQEVGLEFVHAYPFDDYYDLNRLSHRDLLEKFKLLHHGKLVLSKDEHEVANLYMVLVLRKPTERKAPTAGP